MYLSFYTLHERQPAVGAASCLESLSSDVLVFSTAGGEEVPTGGEEVLTGSEL